MSRIRIRNFGPVREGLIENDGWIDIKKTTVFIGDQGSGKSTIAKLISTFSWIEKALTKGDHDIKHFTSHNRFRKNYCEYHKIDKYFFNLDKIDCAEIDYEGDSFQINYRSGKLEINQASNNNYLLPQIMYVPAERNFISTVKQIKLIQLFSGSLVEFMAEFDNAKNAIKGGLQIPINEASVEYDKLNDIVNIKGKDYKVQLPETSSGFQSAVPLFMVSWYLANKINKNENSFNEGMSTDELKRFKQGVQDVWDNINFTDEQRRAALSVLASKFNNSAFINIVEEPEQNLFPGSQKQILNSLLAFVNMNKGNQLILTTHSPYIINFLSLAIQGNYLNEKIKKTDQSEKLLAKLNSIVPLESLISGDDVVIYQLLERNGTIRVLPTFEGIPSDKNLLNKSLADGNDYFDSLLEIEQSL
ncbi:MAG: ATP-binding protein [Ignavibacteriales bacterium]|nr:ATP-binding protein [Ignavibacteriales bacterium]